MKQSNKSLVIVGLQWGDEGKGKFIDYLSGKYDGTVRYNGGNNAGHTVKLGDKTVHFSLIPSAALRGGPVYISQAVIINPEVLLKEISMLKKIGSKFDLKIDPRCHVVLPYHQALDSASEEYKGKASTGSLKLGIGFCYEDRTNRAGVRLVDLIDPKMLKARLEAAWEIKKRRNELVYGSKFFLNSEEVYRRFKQFGRKLKPFMFPVSEFLRENIDKKRFLFEAAQGTYLDFVFGTYPYTVAYHATASAALTDTGLPPLELNVTGICKAYTTRVGNGPFPAEQKNSIGEHLQTTGREFGTVSGRKRRCGWLDLVLVKNAVELNGAKSLILTKLDVLGGLKKIKIAIGYKLKGRKLAYPPVSENDFNRVEPVYREFTGWKQDISKVRKFGLLPANCRKYIKFIENFLGIPIRFISVGPERNQTIRKRSE